MDFDDITLGEIEEIESYANASIAELGDSTQTGTKLKIGLAWIIKRRKDPAFTIEDARKMKASELNALISNVDSKKE